MQPLLSLSTPSRPLLQRPNAQRGCVAPRAQHVSKESVSAAREKQMQLALASATTAVLLAMPKHALAEEIMSAIVAPVEQEVVAAAVSAPISAEVIEEPAQSASGAVEEYVAAESPIEAVAAAEVPAATAEEPAQVEPAAVEAPVAEAPAAAEADAVVAEAATPAEEAAPVEVLAAAEPEAAAAEPELAESVVEAAEARVAEEAAAEPVLAAVPEPVAVEEPVASPVLAAAEAQTAPADTLSAAPISVPVLEAPALEVTAGEPAAAAAAAATSSAGSGFDFSSLLPSLPSLPGAGSSAGPSGEDIAYYGLGAAALSFVATFFVAPRFKEAFKEPVDWRDIYTDLVSRGGVKSVSVEEAYAKANKGAVLLDVRLPGKFETRAAAPATNVPLYLPIAGWDPASNIRRAGFAFFGIYGTELNEAFGEQAAAALPKGKEVMVMCEMGGSLDNKSGTQFGFQSRSLKAVYYLQRAGFTKILHVRGGLAEWQRQGLPLAEADEEEAAAPAATAAGRGSTTVRGTRSGTTSGSKAKAPAKELVSVSGRRK